MKKIIYLVLILLTISGCTARYQLKINDDLSVEESIIGLEDEQFYNQYYNSTKDRVIDFIMAIKMDYLKSDGYTIEKTNENLMYGATVSKKYNNLEEYNENSIAYKQFYNSLSINKNESIIEISTNEKLSKNGQSNDRYVIDDGKIEIIIPFKVLEHNADEVDSKNNMYVWYVNSANDKDIHIKFDFKNKANDVNYVFVLALGIIVSVILIFVFLFRIYNIRQQKKDVI